VGNKFFAVFGKIVLIAIIFGVIAYIGFYFGSKNKTQAPVQNRITIEPTNTQPTEAITLIPTVDETSIIITDIRNDLIAEHGKNASSLNITVSKIEGNYASGAASEQGGGGMWFAAKVNGIWKLVWDGNGTIQCSSLTLYPKFPTDLIPQCWDDKTQNPVKR